MTLHLLYDLVPAAEQEDVLEQEWIEHDRALWAQCVAEYPLLNDQPEEQVSSHDALVEWLTHTFNATVIAQIDQQDQ